MNKNYWFALLGVVVTIIVAGVFYAAEPRIAKSGEASPSVVRVAVLPDMSEQDLRQRYAPLLRYPAEETGFEFNLQLPADYAELLRLFGMGQVHLALFGGLTVVQANAMYHAEPLAMRDVDTRFISIFLVRNNDPATGLSDLEGKALAFGSRLSTSGHLMPRYFLQNTRQIVPEQFFGQIEYSGAHDRTAYMVRDGEADVGAVNAEIVNGMLRDGRLKQGELRVIWETPPYADYVWAVTRYLDENVKTQLRDAYLQLDMNEQSHRQILESLGAGNFLPAGPRLFQPLQRIATDLELLGAQ